MNNRFPKQYEAVTTLTYLPTKTVQRVLAVVRLLFFLMFASYCFLLPKYAWAADSGVEFGAEDDLTVNGTEGTDADPDLEVKGFSEFGASPASTHSLSGQGSVLMAGSLEVDGLSFFDNAISVAGAGDTNIAHDLYLSNATASQISSNKALTIISGAVGQNLDLTLQGRGTGKVYVDDILQVTGTSTLTGNVGIGTTTPGSYMLNVNGGNMYVSGNIVTGGTIGGVTPQTIQTIDFTPEFPTAVLKGTGNGVMTATFDTTAGAYHSYYNWTGNSTNQSYDIYVRVLLPEDFGTWDATAAITYYTNIDATPVNAGVALTVYDTNDSAGYTGAKIQTAMWSANTVASASLTGTYADSDYMTLKFTMTGDSGKNAKLGEVKLKYNKE